MVLSVLFPCFIPEYDAVLHARIIAKWIVPFLLLPDFGRVTRPHTLHFSAIDSPKLHLCTLVPLPGTPFLIPQNTIWDVPFCLLRCPISPFGVYFRHICAQCTAPIFGLSSSFSLPKFVCFLSFRFIMFLRDSFGWIKYIL